jgi:hypothetical protein
MTASARVRSTFLVAMVGVTLGGSIASTVSPSAGAEPVIQVDTHGGFVPLEIVQGNLPEVTVTADGRVITQKPGGAYDRMARLRIARIDDARLAELLDQAREIGLLDESGAVDYGTPGVTDMTDTTVTITVDRDTVSTSVYALTFDSQDLTGDQQANREALEAFIADVADASPRHTLRPKRIAALVTPIDTADGPIVEWPLADLATAGDPAQLAPRCVIVSGDDVKTVLPLAQQARTGTRWHSGDRDWQIVFRPLLPHERTCTDIGAA